MGFSKMTQTLSELREIVKKSDTADTLEHLSKWNQLDRLPCMCCTEKGDISFDKSFFSKEEGQELLISQSQTQATSESLQFLDLLDNETSTTQPQGDLLCPASLLKPTTLAKSELISFASDENTLDWFSSLDKETPSFLLTHYSEPVLSSRSAQSTELRPVGPLAPTGSKSLSQLWLDRLKLTNLSHLVKK